LDPEHWHSQNFIENGYDGLDVLSDLAAEDLDELEVSGIANIYCWLDAAQVSLV
jgi:hypothetical protein